MNEYVAITVALISGLFALLGVVVSNKHNQKQLTQRVESEKSERNKDIVRERLEELYTLFDKWAGSVVMHHVTYRKVMDGILTYNQALDLQVDREHDFDAHRMFMLAELYFSKCHQLLDNVKIARDKATSIQSEFREIYSTSGSPSEVHSNLITSAMEEFSAAVNEYKAALANYAGEV